MYKCPSNPETAEMDICINVQMSNGLQNHQPLGGYENVCKVGETSAGHLPK
jgi:hypothetical protein